MKKRLGEGKKDSFTKRKRISTHLTKSAKCTLINTVLQRPHAKVKMSCSRQEGLIRKNAAYTEHFLRDP